VYYLHNRVEDIYFVADQLKKTIKGSSIGVVHGQMDKDELEMVMEDFYGQKTNILVCTSIIENGIDIANANLIIVEDAANFGLAQLYQIKGRVGRGNRIAYAYLLYRADKRLKAIQEFTELGSGYKIAQRDLSIRGAGDMLGQEQAGFIDTVGYELYTKLVEEAVTGKAAFEAIDPKDNEVFAPRHIDPEYVPFDEVRIEIHKRISELNSMDDINRLKDELIDRFGPIDRD